MRSHRRTLVVLAAITLAVMTSPAVSHAKPADVDLEMYTLRGDQDQINQIVPGLELAGITQTAAGFKADAVLTEAQSEKLAASGIKVSLKRNAKGQTVSEQAELQAANGFNVWRSWDEDGGIEDELRKVARDNRRSPSWSTSATPTRAATCWPSSSPRAPATSPTARAPRCCTPRCSTPGSGSASR